MKKAFGTYVIFWFALFFLFSVVAMATVNWLGNATFWIGYLMIVVSFLGQLLCAYFALKDDGAQKMFYNLSLLRTSYIGLILSVIFGGACMLISWLPYWVGAVLCALVLVINVTAVIKATMAIEEVVRIDEKVKEKTFFIRSITADADSLMARAQTDAAKADCKKVYEALRYSDPMSSDALADVENEIMEQFNALRNAVKANAEEKISAATGELLVLIAERNNKCKLLK